MSWFFVTLPYCNGKTVSSTPTAGVGCARLTPAHHLRKGNAMAKRKPSIDTSTETSKDKFIRLGEQRVGSSLRYIRMVGNLAGPGYEGTPEQKAKIVAALQEAVDEVKQRFAGKQVAAAGFRL